MKNIPLPLILLRQSCLQTATEPAFRKSLPLSVSNVMLRIIYKAIGEENKKTALFIYYAAVRGKRFRAGVVKPEGQSFSLLRT